MMLVGSDLYLIQESYIIGLNLETGQIFSLVWSGHFLILAGANFQKRLHCLLEIESERKLAQLVKY